MALPIVWLAALVLVAVAEAATVSLVSIWFAGGALIAFLVSLFTNSLLTQCIVFLAVSALCLAPVSYTHLYSTSGSGDDVLTHISFTAQPGQVVAIIGGTGEGKSTLVNLIPRFYDVTGGEILVDGVNVKDYPCLLYTSRCV